MKKRYKTRHRLLTNDVGLALFTMVFEQGQAYRYDHKGKRQVKCVPQGNAIGFPKGKYFKDHLIIEFFSKKDMEHYIDPSLKKHFISRQGE